MAVANSNMPLTVLFRREKGMLLATTWPPKVEEADIMTKYRFMYAVSIQVKMLTSNVYLDWAVISEEQVMTSVCGSIIPEEEQEHVNSLICHAGHLMNLAGLGELPPPVPPMYMGVESMKCNKTGVDIPMDGFFPKAKSSD